LLKVYEEVNIVYDNMSATDSLDSSIPAYRVLNSLKRVHNEKYMKHMDMELCYTFLRLLTYPTECKFGDITGKQLANSGFFFTSEQESVQCYFCKLEISKNIFNWQHVDAIDDKHRELNPKCPLVNGEKTSNIPLEYPMDSEFADQACRFIFFLG
jgi:hypothetical protein